MQCVETVLYLNDLTCTMARSCIEIAWRQLADRHRRWETPHQKQQRSDVEPLGVKMRRHPEWQVGIRLLGYWPLLERGQAPLAITANSCPNDVYRVIQYLTTGSTAATFCSQNGGSKQ